MECQKWNGLQLVNFTHKKGRVNWVFGLFFLLQDLLSYRLPNQKKWGGMTGPPTNLTKRPNLRMYLGLMLWKKILIYCKSNGLALELPPSFCFVHNSGWWKTKLMGPPCCFVFVAASCFFEKATSLFRWFIHVCFGKVFQECVGQFLACSY